MAAARPGASGRFAALQQVTCTSCCSATGLPLAVPTPHPLAPPAPNPNPSQVERLASQFLGRELQLNMLILNAGLFHPGPYAATVDGLEQTLQVGYYAQVGPGWVDGTIR